MGPFHFEKIIWEMKTFRTKPIQHKVKLHYHNFIFSEKSRRSGFESYFYLSKRGRVNNHRSWNYLHREGDPYHDHFSFLFMLTSAIIWNERFLYENGLDNIFRTTNVTDKLKPFWKAHIKIHLSKRLAYNCTAGIGNESRWIFSNLYVKP